MLNIAAKGVYQCISSGRDGAELGELLHVLVMLLLLLGFAGAAVAPHYQINRYKAVFNKMLVDPTIVKYDLVFVNRTG